MGFKARGSAALDAQRRRQQEKSRGEPILINTSVWVTRNRCLAGGFVVHRKKPTFDPALGVWESGAPNEHWFDNGHDLELFGLPVPTRGACWFVHIHTDCHLVSEGEREAK